MFANWWFIHGIGLVFHPGKTMFLHHVTGHWGDIHIYHHLCPSMLYRVMLEKGVLQPLHCTGVCSTFQTMSIILKLHNYLSLVLFNLAAAIEGGARVQTCRYVWETWLPSVWQLQRIIGASSWMTETNVNLDLVIFYIFFYIVHKQKLK